MQGWKTGKFNKTGRTEVRLARSAIDNQNEPGTLYRTCSAYGELIFRRFPHLTPAKPRRPNLTQRRCRTAMPSQCRTFPNLARTSIWLIR